MKLYYEIISKLFQKLIAGPPKTEAKNNGKFEIPYY